MFPDIAHVHLVDIYMMSAFSSVRHLADTVCSSAYRPLEDTLKVLGRPLLLNRFDCFSHFREYQS